MSKTKFFSIAIGLLLSLHVVAQQTRSLSEQIRTVQVIVNNDPLLPPVAKLGDRVEIGFDELSHEYIRFIYKVEFCNADWSPATEIFESDYMEGFNGLPIEDYETSFNTTVLYTHYRFAFPNEDVRLKVSGNFIVDIMEDGDGHRVDIAEAETESDRVIIRLNVDDFEEAYELLKRNGYENTRGDRRVRSGSAVEATMVSPSGHVISLIQHMRKPAGRRK